MIRRDGLWRFACGDVFIQRNKESGQKRKWPPGPQFWGTVGGWGFIPELISPILEELLSPISESISFIKNWSHPFRNWSHPTIWHLIWPLKVLLFFRTLRMQLYLDFWACSTSKNCFHRMFCMAAPLDPLWRQSGEPTTGYKEGGALIHRRQFCASHQQQNSHQSLG